LTDPVGDGSHALGEGVGVDAKEDLGTVAEDVGDRT